MRFLGVLICKILYKSLKIINRGSNLPGAIALKLDKNIIKKLKLPKKVVFITGSSGKGSTSNIITHILRDNGYSVCHNTEGANQIPGIVTALLRDTSLFCGELKKDIVVLEIDERTIKYIINLLKPSDIVITNVTRDQPPRQRHTDFIIEEIKKGIPENAHLYLNADDPILRKFDLNKEKATTYFSLTKTNMSYKKNIFNSINATRCPICHAKLNYKFYHFEDLGNYNCPNCDFKIPKSDYIASFDEHKQEITINKKYKIHINNDMLYSIYNTLAAYSVVKQFNISDENVCKSINKLNKNTKVFAKKKLKNRNIYVLNNKCENATTYNQSMLYTLRNKNQKTIILGWQEISRRYIWDELSWLYDIEFEIFQDQNIDTFIVAGPQRYDLAVRLKYAGIKQNKIKICDNLFVAKKNIHNSKGDIYAILNFDYLDDFAKVMEELGWK